MQITHKIKTDFGQQGVPEKINVVQGDYLSRSVEIKLYNNGIAYNVPEAASVLQIVYAKPDGTHGIYDTMPDGSVACTASGNLVTAKLHPQMFAVAGSVLCELRMIGKNGEQLSSFKWIMQVAESAIGGSDSTSEYNFYSMYIRTINGRVPDKNGAFHIAGDDIRAIVPSVPRFDGSVDDALDVLGTVLFSGVLAEFRGALDAFTDMDLVGLPVVDPDAEGGYRPMQISMTGEEEPNRDVPLVVPTVELVREMLGGALAAGTADVTAQYETARSAGTVATPLEFLWTLSPGRYFISENLQGNILCRYYLHTFAGETRNGITSLYRILYVANDYCTIKFYGSSDRSYDSVPDMEISGETGDIYIRGVRLGAGGDGKSAYELAVEQGFEGSVAAWLASLVGPPGTPGKDGHTPRAGVDYYTPADRAEFKAFLATELAKRGQLKPEFASSVEKCTDPTKLYVLDGMIWAYMPYESINPGGEPLFVNQANPQSSDWHADARLSSSSSEIKSCVGSVVSNAISAKSGDVIRIKGLRNGTVAATANAYVSIAVYSDEAGTTLSMGPTICFDKTKTQHSYGVKDIVEVADGVIAYNAFEYVANSGNTEQLVLTNPIVSFRVCGEPVTTVEDIIVTVNEEIRYSEESSEQGYRWQSTGRAFVPADYEERIVSVEKSVKEHTAKIAALEKAVETGGADESEKAAYTRMKNWKYPIHEDSPVFLLETDKPAIPSADWNTDAVYAKYNALMSANSHYITREEHSEKASDGTTPLYVYHFREPEPHYNGTWSETKPVILVCSGVHPTEQSGVWSLYYAMEEITTNPKLADLRRNIHFIVMPMINPTAFSDNTYGVRNPDGIQVHYNFEVDFKYPTDSGYVAHGNRNHGGETPLSIPETQYFDALMNEYKDTLACVLSCHNNDVDTQWGTGFVWSSCATHFMCNLGFRLVDKLSAAWREKHGAAFDEGVRWANNYALTQKAEGSSLFPNAVEQAEWDYRVGRASLSASGGTEYKQALKYGVHGINVEVCDRCMILDRDFNKKRTANVTTMGAETYINFFRTFMAVYDPKDKKDYAPNLPQRGDIDGS